MLGPLEVRDGAGSPREVSGTRLRALLVLLALRAGQVVPASALIDELWGERLPAEAQNALQALVSRLRRAVGEPATVVSGPAGYQLMVDRDDIDVFRFERLASSGRAWTARLRELRLAATEDRIDAELRLSELRLSERVTELVAELEGLIAANPTRETLAALLMRALAADGRRGAALLVYERTRERLADELGADPSPRLAALHVELLRAAEPRGNLPAALTSFLGRESDLERGRRAAARAPSGHAHRSWRRGQDPARDRGRTRRAWRHWRARRAASRRGLAGRARPGDRPGGRGGDGAERARVARAGAADHPAGARRQCRPGRRRRRARPPCRCARRTAGAARARQLRAPDRRGSRPGRPRLARCPGMRVLATSREPLNITGEALWPVGPLAESPAERLFAERAAAVSPGFERTTGESPRLCPPLPGARRDAPGHRARRRADPRHDAGRRDRRPARTSASACSPAGAARPRCRAIRRCGPL